MRKEGTMTRVKKATNVQHICNWKTKLRHICTRLMGMLTGAATVENTMEVSPKLKTELPYEPAILLLDSHLIKPKILTQKDTCTSMFLALFTIAKL